MPEFTEIERKWSCSWDVPASFPLINRSKIERQYLSVNPEVRLTRRIQNNGITHNLTIKGNGVLERTEVRLILDREQYERIRSLIPVSPLLLETKSCLSPEGLRISVKHCVQLDITFAEIEFESLEESHNLDCWKDAIPFFYEEVTDCPAFYVKNMWCKYANLRT